MKQYKIILVIHEIHPRLGSECHSGYQFLRVMKDYLVDLPHLVVVPDTNIFGTENYASELQDEFANINFLVVPQVALWQSYLRKQQELKAGVGNPLVYYFNYYLWQFKVYRVLKGLSVFSDIIHIYNHINIFLVSTRLSDFCSKLVVGPVTGFSKVDDFIGKFSWKETRRSIVQKCAMFRLRLVLAKVDDLILVSKEDVREFGGLAKRSYRLPEQCLVFKEATPLKKSSSPLLLTWIGELVERKGLDVLLRALIGMEIEYSLSICGEGPLKKDYTLFAKKNGINVNFYGRVKRERVFEILGKSHALCHTSYREGTATTIVEALSLNNFIICHDIGGHDLIVNSGNGYCLPLQSKTLSVKLFKDSILDLNRRVLLGDMVDNSDSINWFDFKINMIRIYEI